MSNLTQPVVIAAVRKYGVPPSIIQHIAINNFRITQNYRDCFQRYYLLFWRADYLLDQIEQGALKLGFGAERKDWIVVYHKCTRGTLLGDKSAQVALSFREPQPEFGLPAYCLVSLPQ